MQITIHGEELQLLAEHAIYLPKRKTLWVADALLGKPAHTKTGNWMAPDMVDADIIRLSNLLKEYDVEKLVFVGHLFYYAYADKRTSPGEWLATQELEVHWINGHEHDAEPMHYAKFNLTIHDGCYTDGPFVFMNEYDAATAQQFEDKFIISANANPAYEDDKTGQLLPCFYFTDGHAILPSFGNMKGLKLMQRQNPTDRFYPINATAVLNPIVSV